jgi:hypothetical protein
MKTYIFVIFLLLCVEVAIRSIVMTVSPYPRSKLVSLGMDTVDLIFELAILAWAGWLLWGK